MVVLGDVFAVVAALVGIGLSAWALAIGIALLFPQRADASRMVLERRPWRSFGIGLAVVGVAGWLSVALAAQPQPGAKLLGTLGLMALMAVGFLGFSGLASLAGRRIQPLDPELSKFRAMGRGAGILVLGTLLPFLGWWVFAPIMLVFSVGAGLQSLFAGAAGRAHGGQHSFDMGVA